ncbi:MAG: hypothetical protein AABY16_04455 [Nanoarchaeota archaeon]
MRKEWWYVIALVAVILLIMVVFKENVGLGPKINSKVNKVSSVTLAQLATGESLDMRKANNYVIASKFMGRDGVGLNELIFGDPTTNKIITGGFVEGGVSNE